jgi:hypothetical protein
MRTPSGSTWAQFSESLKQFLDRQCFLLDNKLLCCDCGGSIVHSRVVVSIHDPAFHGACAAFDRGSWNMTLPYCPRCEEKAEEHGCLHLCLADVRNAA